MIITKYPEWVEAQLKIIDERIEAIYREYENVKLKPDEAMRLKQNLAKRIQPFVDEKVRLISNSCPTYIQQFDKEVPKEKYDGVEVERYADVIIPGRHEDYSWLEDHNGRIKLLRTRHLRK